MADVSPPKWHLAHVSWFFEEFVLRSFNTDYQEFDPAFSFLFNSYYNTVGSRHPRPERGHLSRPTVARIKDYRQYIDDHMLALLAAPEKLPAEAIRRIGIGLNHEQQHQELLLTDIKFNFFSNPLLPVYNPKISEQIVSSGENPWRHFSGTSMLMGAETSGFTYDNEGPVHQKYVPAFALASQMVTNAGYLEFIDAGGYQNPEYWLADGWDFIQNQQIESPLYWRKTGTSWEEFTLAGTVALNPAALVAHVSFYEADAYAQFRGHRLPYEAEWELAGKLQEPRSRFILEQNTGQHLTEPLQNLYGTGWQWTIDSYLPYPGFRAENGALGEYNGKFMCNQKVLRGGSLFTPAGHIRPSYRNFFPPQTRWQRTHIRLASSDATKKDDF